MTPRPSLADEIKQHQKYFEMARVCVIHGGYDEEARNNIVDTMTQSAQYLDECARRLKRAIEALRSHNRSYLNKLADELERPLE